MGIDVLPDGSGNHHTGYNELSENGASHHTVGYGANWNQGRPSHGVENANGNQDTSSYGVENTSGNRGASSHGVENASGIQGTSSYGVENANQNWGVSSYGGERGKRNPNQAVTRRRMGQRISEHHYTGQMTIGLCKAFRNADNDGTSRFPAKVDAAFTPFIGGVSAVDTAYRQSRASDYTQQIADEDMRRDNLYKALKNQVLMYIKFTFDAEKKEAGDYLWNIMKKYNVNPDERSTSGRFACKELLRGERGAAADAPGAGRALDLVACPSKNYQAELRIKKLGLESLVKQLTDANEAVRTLMTHRNDERMYQVKAALTTARAEADTEYHSFILALNSAAVMDDNEARFNELISQINELIKYYRQYVVPKKGGSGASDEDEDGNEPTDGASSDGSSSKDSKESNNPTSSGNTSNGSTSAKSDSTASSGDWGLGGGE